MWDACNRVAFVVCAAGLAALGCGPRVTSTPAGESLGYSEEGPEAHTIVCTHEHKLCLERALELCPHGYDVVSEVASSEGTSHGVVHGNVHGGEGHVGGYMAGETHHRGEMTIVCQDAGAEGIEASIAKQEEEKEQRRKRARDNLGDPPTGAAGFDFGITPEQAQEVCEGAELAFAGKGSRYECAGTPAGVGMAASTHLRFCNGQLCVIVVEGELDPNDGSKWKKSFLKLKRGLTKRYGEPTHDKIEWPSTCQKDDELVGCLQEGTASLRLDWTWGKSSGIVLMMGARKTEKGAASLRLTYASDKVSKTGEMGGL